MLQPGATDAQIRVDQLEILTEYSSDIIHSEKNNLTSPNSRASEFRSIFINFLPEFHSAVNSSIDSHPADSPSSCQVKKYVDQYGEGNRREKHCNPQPTWSKKNNKHYI